MIISKLVVPYYPLILYTEKVTNSLTTALEEMTINNELLRREVDVLKTDNAQLSNNNDAMSDKSKQLTTLVDKMVINNEK